MDPKSILIKPIITEKSTDQAAWGKFAFQVNPQATKNQISQAVQKYFNVHPISIKTINIKGKTRRDRRGRGIIKQSGWKKAIITLKEGEKIDLFEVSE